MPNEDDAKAVPRTGPDEDTVPVAIPLPPAAQSHADVVTAIMKLADGASYCHQFASATAQAIANGQNQWGPEQRWDLDVELRLKFRELVQLLDAIPVT